MDTQQKPPELLAAQVALYANDQREREFRDRQETLLSRLGEVAAYSDRAPDHVTYPLKFRVRRPVGDDIVTIAERGDEMPLFDNAEYTAFLGDPANRETSRELAWFITQYDEVEPQIERMGIVGLDLEHAKQHPNFLAHGGSNMVFRFNGVVGGEEKQLVALFSQLPDSLSIRTGVNTRAICLAKAHGLAGFERGAAVSYNPPVVVTELAPGMDMASMSYEERRSIPARHWDELEKNIMSAVERGISVDYNSDNFIYDPEIGFTVIDFRLRNKQISAEDGETRERKALAELKEKVLTQVELSRN